MGSTVATARSKSRPEKPAQAYGGWDFARDFSNGLFGLFNTGRIFPAFGVLLFMIMALVLYRIPDSDLAGVIEGFFSFLQSSTALAYFLFFASNVGWLRLHKRQERLYQAEIDRMAAIRKELMHGGESKTLIQQHRSSDGEQSEGYLLPQLKMPPSKESKS